MMDTFLAPLANHLWQSTFAVLALWPLTLVLRRNRAAVRFWLWMAASVKFLIPFALLVSIGGQLHWRSATVVRPPEFSAVISQFGRPFPTSVPAATHAVAHTPDLFPSILFGLWLCGATLGLIFWLQSLRRMHAIRRAAAPLAFDFPIPVVSSPARLEPGVLGICRPVLLLPEGLSERLTPAQLKAVLAHELCHVRRHDNLTGAIHMLVEIIFWFHPLVWWIRARLVAERERACDEEVLRTCPDASVYAEGILNVCRFYVESPPLSVAGVTGANLKTRIEEIVAHRTAKNLSASRKLLLAAIGLAAVAAPIVFGAFGALPIRAQSQTAVRLAFAAASIRESKSRDKGGMDLKFLPGGRLVVHGVPLSIVVATAYDLPFQSGRLSGGPEWIYRTAFDIEATAEEGAIPADASTKIRDGKIRLMLQTLFADRFKMSVRREIKDLPLYAIVVRNGGPKLQQSAINEKDCASEATTLGDAHSCHSFAGGQGRGVHGEAVTISDLASWISNWADRPIIDKTGLTQLYNLQTDGWVPMRPRPPRPPGQEPSAEDLAFADPLRSTLFQIFDRLGLKLESETGPVETFVIEHAERPNEN
jgi:bla regulator protein blaR1